MKFELECGKKKFKSDKCKLSFGTIRKAMEIIEPDTIDLSNTEEVAKKIIKAFPLVPPILKDIFRDIKDDDIDQADIMDIAAVFIAGFEYLSEQLGLLSTRKN